MAEKVFRYISGDGGRAKVGRDGLPSDGTLPRGVADYIGEGGMGDGSGRNNALFRAATQLRDEGWTAAEVEGKLMPVSMGAGLSQHESQSCIASAFKGTKREPAVGASGSYGGHGGHGGRGYGAHGVTVEEKEILTPALQKVKAAIKKAGPVAVPAPRSDGGGLREYIEALFEPGDGIGLSRTAMSREGEAIILPEQPKGYQEMLDIADKAQARAKGDGLPAVDGSGIFVRINPFPLRGEFEDETDHEAGGDQGDPNESGFVEKLRYSEENVAQYRHTLIEWDDCPKELQLGRLISSGLPIAAIIDSGGKSLHGIVRVDAENAQIYAERVQMIHALFEGTGLDSSCRNASRLSRLPDAARSRDVDVLDKESFKDPSRITWQRLISGPVGPESWRKFEAETGGSALGEEWDIDELLAFDHENDPNNLFESGWMGKGESLMIVSASGIGKSTLICQLAVGWTLPNRRDITLNIQPIRPLKVAILEAENSYRSVSKTFKGIINGFKLSGSERKLMKQNLKFRHVSAFDVHEFISELEAYAIMEKPDVIVIDPLSAYLEDLLDTSAVREWLYLRMSAIQERTGVMVAIVHHVGKPPRGMDAVEVSPTDLQYSAMGSSIMNNWARDVVVLRRVLTEENSTPVFAIASCKKRQDCGLMSFTEDHLVEPSRPVDTAYFQHSSDGMPRWIQCAKPEEAKGKGKSSREKAKSAMDGVGEASEAERAKLLSALSPGERKYLLGVIEGAGGLSFRPSTEELDEISAGLQKSRTSARRYFDTVMEAVSRGGLASLSTFVADVKDAPDIKLAEGIRTPAEWKAEYDRKMAEAVAKGVTYVDGRGDTEGG